MDFRSTPAVSLRQLQYIVAVADLRGFRKAAEACHVAQPSLSAQIALAEQHLGLRLFERDRRRVRVVPAARPVIDQARSVLAATSDLVELARRRSNPFDGTLRLGVIPTIAPYLLPDVTPALTRAFPALSVLWTEGRTTDLLQQIREATLDGALLALEADVTDLEHEVVAWDPFVLAAAPGHPLMRTDAPASAEALVGTQVLLLDDGHCLRDQALAVCQRSGAREDSFRATSLATLVQVVSGGTSVTLLPSLALPVENRRAQIRTRRFASPQPGRTLALAWRRRSSLDRALAAIATVCKGAIRIDQSIDVPSIEVSMSGPVDQRGRSVRPSVTKSRKRARGVTVRSRRTGARS